MSTDAAQLLRDYAALALGLSIPLHASWCAWLVARRALPGAGLGARACAWFVALLWLSSALFATFVAARAFELVPAALAWLALAFVLARSLDPERLAIHELNALVRGAARRARALARTSAGFALVPLALFLIAGWARASVAPPLGWDALTYHLVKAARWVQGSGLYLEPAPDAWSYYRWFGWLGDAPWSWSLLALRSDMGLASVNALVVVATVLAARELARELGADGALAWMIATVIALVPAVQRFWFMDYVDGLVLACALLGALFAMRALRRASAADAAFALAALTLAAGIKPLGLAFVFAGGMPLALAGARGNFGARGKVALTALAIAAPGLAHYALVGVLTGEPLYPHRVAGLGAGNAELAQVLRGDGRAPFAPFLDALFGAHRATAGFGPAGALLAIAGALGWVAALGRVGASRTLASRAPRAAAFVFLAAALACALPFLSDDAGALRMRWAPVSARFLAPSFAVLALGVVLLPRKLALGALAIAIAQSALLAWPRGWSTLDARALGWFLAGILPPIVIVLALLWRPPPLGERALTAFAVATLALLPWRMLCERFRHAYYDAASRAVAFEAHPLGPMANELWSLLDTPEPKHIAVTAGYEPPGHHLTVYPLFGSRLQNRVEYVPISAGGAESEEREPSARATAADERVWLERLLERGVDVVVTLDPRDTPEDRWIAAQPEVFAALARARCGVAWRFDRDAARLKLARR